jgi:hypothetical protein
MKQREDQRMTEIPEGKPSHRTLTAEEFGRLPNAEFCDVVESILSDPVRNEGVIRMLAVADGDDIEDIIKNLKRVIEAMRHVGS